MTIVSPLLMKNNSNSNIYLKISNNARKRRTRVQQTMKHSPPDSKASINLAESGYRASIRRKLNVHNTDTFVTQKWAYLLKTLLQAIHPNPDPNKYTSYNKILT